MDAGNVRTVSRSEAAREAAQADKCRQRYESGEADQSHDHGEEVRRELGSGRIVCSECGTAHDIDQDQTLVEAQSPDGPTVATDGGVEVPDREEELRSRWENADAAAVVGESPKRRKQRRAVREAVQSDMKIPEYWAREVDVQPPDNMEQLVAEVEHPEYQPSEVVGFDNSVPTWHVKSVTIDGEERPASAGNGIDMVEIQNVHDRLVRGCGIVENQRYRCECGTAAYGETVVHHVRTHGVAEPELAEWCIEEESV